MDLRQWEYSRLTTFSTGNVDRATVLDYYAPLAKETVRVLRKEAVGMYEVVVLEAGSAAALKKWVEQELAAIRDQLSAGQ